MKRLMLILLAVLLLWTTACAESASALIDAGQLTLQDLQVLNGGNVNVYTENGRVTFVGGTCTAETVTGEEDAARVVDAMTPLLGGNERTRFVPWRVVNDSFGNVYYIFQQIYADTTVMGGAVKVITDAQGTMTGLTASVISDLPATEEPETLTAEQAAELVRNHQKKAGFENVMVLESLTRKIVLPVKMEPDLEEEEPASRFVWAVYSLNPETSVAGTDLPYLAHYVTLTGEYLYSLPTILPGDPVGATGFSADYVFEFMEPAEYTGYVDLYDGTEKEITVPVMRDTRTGMYYLGNLEHKIVVADCWEFLYNDGNIVLEFSPDNREWDQVGLLSLYNYCRAYDYYKAIGWTGGDGLGTPIIILKNYCDKDHKPVNNAAYAGKYYGWQTFLSSSANTYSQALDVIAHEFTHCVTGTVMTSNSYLNDYGAINEAMSDIQGNICEMMAGATGDESWILGENSGSPVRSMSDPHSFKQPEYSWDLYYTAHVKDPTEANDRGGVHTNSSLLNHLAWLLCEKGGMTLEEARAYWFAVDCSMVPGSDFPQLRELLPWVLKNVGLEKYQEALADAINATRLGDADRPETLAEDQVLLMLNLPDTEVFNDGRWLLNVFSVNTDQIQQIYHELMYLVNNAEKGTDELPAPEELVGRLREQLQNIVFISNGNAGQDGHTIWMMSKPGRTIPILMYLATESAGSDQLKQMDFAIFLNGHWLDLTGLFSGEATGEDQTHGFFESALFRDVMEIALSAMLGEDYLEKLTLNVPGGAVFEIPTTGLENITLDSNMAQIFREIQKESPTTINETKSRPKTETPGEGAEAPAEAEAETPAE